MALRILDLDLCIVTMSDLLARPYISIPYLHIRLITALKMKNLFSIDRWDFFAVDLFCFKSICFLFCLAMCSGILDPLNWDL
jgi:hypothetical protein